MIHKNLIFTTLLLFLLPVLAWGDGETIDLSLPENSEGVTIDNDGTYTLAGTYPSSATPGQDINGTKKAVINVAVGKEVTIILDNVNISLIGKNQCPLSAKDAKMVTVKLKGKNVLSTKHASGQCPGLWAPEANENELVIQNGETDGSLGMLKVQGAQSWPGIGISQGQKGKITIESGYIIAKAGSAGAGIGGSSGGNYKGVITINGGIISANGGEQGAGIGGGFNGDGGSIIINNGTINATGGGGAAGIGGGLLDYNEQYGSSIILINGGIIKAKGGEDGAGIGGGYSASAGEITINGGIVEAKGDNEAVGIGAGSGGNGGRIIINGGTVNAIGGTYSSAGIGTDGWGDKGSFSTGTNGNAFIIASSINANIDNSQWQGIIFEGNDGSIYGSPTLFTDAVIPEGKTLSINTLQTLTVNSGVTLVNIGTINNDSGGSIVNSGTILNVAPGNITGTPPDNAAKTGFAVTCHLNYDDAPSEEIQYIESGKKLSDPIFSPKGYAFDGWYTKATDGTPITTISAPVDAYANWKSNMSATEINAFPTISNFTYSGKAISITAPDVMDKANNSKITDAALSYLIKDILGSYSETTAENSGADATGGAPIYAGDYKVIASYVGDDSHYKADDQEATFIINKKALQVIPDQDQKLYADETPTYKVEGAVNGDVPEFEGVLTIEGTTIVAGNDFKLKAPFDRNYSFTITGDVSVTILGDKVAEATATKSSMAEYGGWHTGAVTITAPEGFKIAFISSRLKSALTFEDNFIWDNAVDGCHIITYALQRQLGEMQEFAGKTIEVKLDKQDPYLANEKPQTSDLSATFTLKDDGSGIASYSYTLNGSNQSVTVDNAPQELSFNVAGKNGDNAMTLTITDIAGHTKIYNDISFALTAEPEPEDPDDPVIPDDPDPTPVIYTVILPVTEGVTFSPAAGRYYVNADNDFVFSLTIDEGYREQSHPVVTLSDGTILEPDASGRYTIAGLSSDQVILVSGIEKDTPVANEALSAGAQLTVFRNAFRLQTDRAATLYIFTINGRLDRSIPVAPGETRVGDLPSGAYILCLSSGERWKVIMR
ncbi:hypothetical protein HMPREF1212_02640 [Parabacteroides sp. HGS0025]|nr:hypothetical protein HMPREF1212_02640 [Parabacteroides sp. HGS0025]